MGAIGDRSTAIADRNPLGCDKLVQLCSIPFRAEDPGGERRTWAGNRGPEQETEDLGGERGTWAGNGGLRRRSLADLFPEKLLAF